MSTEQPAGGKGRYFTVIDGTFRVQVPKDHPEAVEREWSTKDGKSGVKYERHVKALFGRIEGISITEGEFGKNLNIALDETEDGETPIISVGLSSRHGESLLKLLPNLEPGQEYRFMPYQFEDTGKRGVSVAGKDSDGNFTEKVLNFYTKQEGDKWVPANGYPEPTEEDKSDWPFYYKRASKFMEKYATENVLPKFKQEEKGFEYPAGDEVNPEDLPAF